MINMRNIALKISIIFNILLIFFGANIGTILPFFNLFLLDFIALFFSVIACMKFKVKVKIDTLMWILCIVFSAFSLIYTTNTEATMKFIMLLFCGVMSKALYENTSGWSDFFIKLLLIGSSVHVFFTIAECFLPDMVSLINSKILAYDAYTLNLSFANLGAYAGITGQTGVNAFYIAIFIGVMFSKIVTEKKGKLRNVIFLFIGIYALFLTSKRGMIVATVIAIMFTILIASKLKLKQILKHAVIFAVFCGIGLFILFNTQNNIINKVTSLSESGDISNGREVFWAAGIRMFEENPVFGLGMNTMDSTLGDMVHNVYIQLLSEGGIVGFTLFMLAFIFTLISNIKEINRLKEKNSVTIVSYVKLYVQIIFYVYSITESPLYILYFLITYMITSAMTYDVKKIQIEENKEGLSNNFITII